MKKSSTDKISQVAFKVLTDAGCLKSTRNKELQTVCLLPETSLLLTQMNRGDILAAMEV
ncbi:MAG: DUF1819 family protein [Psychromonas sp.]|nr:DUF1819 family protein [Psychromonas sp.]